MLKSGGGGGCPYHFNTGREKRERLFTIYKKFPEILIRLERKWNTTFSVFSVNFGSNGKSEKVVLLFPDRRFQTEICVSFLQSHL